MTDKIYIAKLGKTVGLNGQQKLHIDSDFPEQFRTNAKFFTNKNEILVIETFNVKNNVIKFKDINSIEDARKLTNRELFVTQDDTKDMCKLANKQFFWFDMITCEVYENDIKLGVVNDIQRMPLSDYLQIKTTKELQDKKLSNTFLLPYIDDYIISVDIVKKQILIKNGMSILEAS